MLLWQAVDFFRTICQRPDRSARVYRVAIGGIEERGLSIEDLLFMIEHAMDHGMSLPEDWNPPTDEDLDEGVFDPYQWRLTAAIYVDMLLSTVVNIQQLHLEVVSETQYGSFLPPSTTLSFLRALKLDGEDSRSGFSLEVASGIFEMAPRLELLEVYMCTSAPSGLAVRNLKWPRLQDSILDLEELRDLTTACSNLESFIFHTSLSDDEVPLGTDGFIPRELCQGLLPCKDTLRYLEVQCGWECWNDFGPQDVITSLKEFTALETLVLDGGCICCGEDDLSGSDREDDEPIPDVNTLINLLPASIISVTIDGTYPSLYEPILVLAQEIRNGTFPRLREFRETGVSPRVSSHSFEPLNNAMRNSGVMFVSSQHTVFHS